MISSFVRAAYSSGGKFSEISSSWMPAFMAGRVSASGQNVGFDASMTSSAVFACVRCISETIGSLPKQMIRREGPGRREYVEDHPSIPVLSREANPFTSAMSFFETLQSHAMTYGNGYAELEMLPNTGKVVRAWIIPPDSVDPRRVELEDGSYGLVYVVTLPEGRQVMLPRERMLHVPGIGFDGLVGYPVLDYAAKAITLGKDLEDFGVSYFSNGDGMAGYVEVPAGMDFDSIVNLKKSMEMMNSGLSNMHRDKFLLDGVKFTPAQKKPNESQMIESRTFQIQDVARFFRIPLAKIGELSKANYNSMEQMQDEFRTDTIVPWAVRWEQEINRKFFSSPDDANLQIKFNTNALLRGDSTSRSAYYRTMVSFGLMTQNEIRALEDLPWMENADELRVPLNMVSQTQAQEQEQAREQVQGENVSDG